MIRYLLFLSVVLILSKSHGQSIDVESWTQDITFYKTNLEKHHIDLYNKIDKTEFDHRLRQIKSALNKKSDLDVVLDLMRLTRKIGDGHTAVSLRGMETHLFPIEIYKIDGQWRVIKATKSHENLLGNVLTKIADKSIDQVADKISEVAQYVENEQSGVYRTGKYLTISEMLYGLQLVEDELQAEFSFLDEKNEESKVLLRAIKRDDFNGKTEFEKFNLVVPEIQKPVDAPFDFLWFSPIKNTQGIYIRFESYPPFEGMENFGESVLSYVNENRIEQVVIDLRNNGGGDFFVGTFLAYYLNLANSIDWKSGVYVLTDRVTFSAGTSNASQFRQILNAKIVGEPTGSNPTGYQDMGQFMLPNSGVIITYSKRLFRFQDQRTQGIQPDVLMEYHWGSYSKGIDDMMEWIINDIKEK